MTELALVVAMWVGLRRPAAGARLAYERHPTGSRPSGSSYHLGVDGLSLPLLALTTVLFAACAVYALRRDRPATRFAALFLFLETTCLGLFASADLILFFVFFDLSIVAMYFVIAGWGHGDAARSALKFFLYTFLGSLALLVGFIGLYVGADPHTFDMVDARRGAARSPGTARPGGLVLAGDRLGLAVKTPTVPVPHLAAARAHRRPGAGRRSCRRAAEDGHLRLRPDRDADAARRLARLGARSRRRRRRLGALRARWSPSRRPTSSG